MYVWLIVLMMGVLPVLSIVLEPLLRPDAAGFVDLVGRWFVFWAGGIRLFLAGLRQTTKPEFTAEKILGIKDPAALVAIQELGFANLATGAAGIASLVLTGWVVPVAFIAAVFLGLAGIKHLRRGSHTGNETVAMVSDLAVALVLGLFVIAALAGA
ncbi:DUF6790 family protein [Microbaculum marinum]|uniref:DUF6790 family protein n=1 Tax=Microbaculum marinum TaxID=1764581 RepID=A0AAW9RLF8_9HYPH